MTIGGSTGLGSDLARVQQESFNSLVSLDCKRIANAITNNIISKCIKKYFGDVETKCRFEYIESDETTAEEYLALAEKAKMLGISIDVAELKRLTKLSFISDEVKDVWQPAQDNKDEGIDK